MDCHIKIKEPSLSYIVRISAMWNANSIIQDLNSVAMSIAYDNNHYTTSALRSYIIKDRLCARYVKRILNSDVHLKFKRILLFFESLTLNLWDN